LEIVRGLARAGKPSGSSLVLLGARNTDLGTAALRQLNDEGLDNIELLQIAIDSEASVTAAARTVRERYGRLDVLINNAGFAFGVDATEPVSVQSATTVGINYYGTVRVTNAFLPLLRASVAAAGAAGATPGDPRPRVINVSSRAGLLKNLGNDDLRARFTAPTLTEAGLNALVAEYLSVAAKDDPKALEAAGWPNTTYGLSKIAESAYGRVLARTAPDILVTSMCPGWCRTDMAGQKAPRSAAEGADTVIWLVDAAVESGKFYADRAEIEY